MTSDDMKKSIQEAIEGMELLNASLDLKRIRLELNPIVIYDKESTDPIEEDLNDVYCKH